MPSLHRSFAFACSMMSCVAGCGPAMESPDAATRDAAPSADARPPDARVDDGGAADASAPDGGRAVDAGRPGCSSPLPAPDAPAVPVDGAETFASLAAGMSSGEWVQYDTTASERYFRNGDGGHDLTWGDTAVWDPASQCVLHYGGGHLVVPAFSIYCVRTNTWIRGTLPHWLDFEGSVWGYTNHGYDRNAYDPETRRLFFYRGRRLWVYDLGCDEWSEQELMAGNQTARDFASWVPGLGVVHGRGENDSILFAYDPDTGTQTRLADSQFHSQLHTFGEYSPLHGLLFYGGGDGNQSVYTMDEAGVSRRVTDSPEPIRTVSSGASGGWVTTDPNTGDFLVLFVGGELRRYDPVGDAWRLESTSPFESGINRTISATLPEHGVILFATRTGSEAARVTLYKP